MNGRKAWLWTVVGRLGTLFAVRTSRSRAMATDLLGEKFNGIVVSDRYLAYSHLEDHCHQFCWAHLLRDFQAMIDRGGCSADVGAVLKQCGQELIHHWNRLQSRQILRATFDGHYRRSAARFSTLCTTVRCVITLRRQKRVVARATSVSVCSCLCIITGSRRQITRLNKL